MKRFVPFALGLVLAFVCAVAVAQTTTVVMAEGKLISSSPSALVIEIASGERMTFVVDAQSVVPADLVIERPVSIEYHRLADGTLHLSKVTLVSEPASATLVQETEYTPPPTEPAPTATAAVAEEEEEEEALPQTASPLPLLALAGFAALSGAGFLRWRRNR